VKLKNEGDLAEQMAAENIMKKYEIKERKEIEIKQQVYDNMNKEKEIAKEYNEYKKQELLKKDEDILEEIMVKKPKKEILKEEKEHELVNSEVIISIAINKKRNTVWVKQEKQLENEWTTGWTDKRNNEIPKRALIREVRRDYRILVKEKQYMYIGQYREGGGTLLEFYIVLLNGKENPKKEFIEITLQEFEKLLEGQKEKGTRIAEGYIKMKRQIIKVIEEEILGIERKKKGKERNRMPRINNIQLYNKNKKEENLRKEIELLDEYNKYKKQLERQGVKIEYDKEEDLQKELDLLNELRDYKDEKEEYRINKIFEENKKEETKKKIDTKWVKEPLKEKTNQELIDILEFLKIDKKYQDLILKYRYSFGQAVKEIDMIPTSYFEFELKENVKPFYKQSGEMPREGDEEIKKQMTALYKEGIIERAENSEWLSPSHAIPKKRDKVTGEVTFRVVQDYRGLNLATKPIQMVFPKIDHLTDTLGRFKYFTALDCLSGYYHIGIPREYRKYMAFGVPGLGAFQPTRMFFGLRNAPAIYQKTIQAALGDMTLYDWCKVYIDDIIIAANTKEELLERTEQAFKLLTKAGFKLKLSKCEFEQEEVEILGWRIKQGKRWIAESRIKTILDWEWGNNMESFIGIINYISKQIPIKHELIKPIIEATDRTTDKKNNIKKKAKRRIDDPEAIAAFEMIKEIITKDPYIVNVDWDKPVEIYTDASDTGYGGVIKQDHGIIAYYGKQWTETERKWNIYRKELYAMYNIISENRNKMKLYTPGKVIVYCDNKPVVDSLNKKKDAPIDIAAQTMHGYIIELDLNIQHISRKINVLADAMSKYRKRVEAEKDKMNIKKEMNNINKEMNNNKDAEISINNINRGDKLTKEQKRLNKLVYSRTKQVIPEWTEISIKRRAKRSMELQ
jgi:hypothetical protein